VTARIPTDEAGQYDVEAQQKISDRFDEMRTFQSQLTEQLANLSMLRYEWPYLEEENPP